jgi:hypothetical protein
VRLVDQRDLEWCVCAVVGATALEAGASLLPLDRRAVGVYQLLRVDDKIVG